MPFECAAERPSQSQEHLSARVQETQVEASAADSGPRAGGGGLRPGAAAYQPEDEMEVDRGGDDDKIASLKHWSATEQRLSTEIVERGVLAVTTTKMLC